MTKSISSETEVKDGIYTRLNRSRGGGQPLREVDRSFMGKKFGVNFSEVRVHTDGNAVQMSRELNAEAFTQGRDIYFGAGRYSPGTSLGKKLLAHELTHVLQQDTQNLKTKRYNDVRDENSAGRSAGSPIDEVSDCNTMGKRLHTAPKMYVQRRIGDGHDLTAARFAGNDVLEAVYDDERLIRRGSRGLAVRLIQQSLLAQGYALPRFGSDGIFGLETEGAVRQFQTNHRIKIDGIVGPETMEHLNRHDPGNVPSTPTPVSLTYTTVAPKTNLGCGGFSWGVRWGLGGATAATSGFVVQQLTFNLSRERCTGGRNDFRKTYWEAWQVRGGNIFVGTTTAPHSADTFSVPPTPDQRGINYEEGQATYIDGYTAPTTWGHVPEALSLPATTTMPAGWNGHVKLFRWLRNEFDCCAGRTNSNFTSHG